MKKLSPLEEQVQEQLVNILKDTLEDSKRIIKRLQLTLVFVVALLVFVCLYYEHEFKSFLSQYDLENTVTQEFETNGSTKGNVNIYDINKNSSIKK